MQTCQSIRINVVKAAYSEIKEVLSDFDGVGLVLADCEAGADDA